MKKNLIIFLTIFSLNFGFISNAFSMKRKRQHPITLRSDLTMTLRSGKKKKINIREPYKRRKVVQTYGWPALKENNQNIIGPLIHREINGYSRQFGSNRIYNLIDSRFNGCDDNDDDIVIDALIDYSYCVLEKIISYLRIDLNVNSEFEQDAKEFIRRWKDFFENKYVYDCLFRDLELDLTSSLNDNFGPLYILQPLKIHTQKIKNTEQKVVRDQFEELKKICLQGIVDIVSLYFTIETLYFIGNNLKHVSWYIFKLKHLKSLQNNLLQDLDDDYAKDVKEEYQKEKRGFHARLNNIFEINRGEETNDELIDDDDGESFDFDTDDDFEEGLDDFYWFG